MHRASIRFSEYFHAMLADGHTGTSFQPMQWRPWSQQEMDASQASTSGRSDASPSSAVNPFTNFVTQTYAK